MTEDDIVHVDLESEEELDATASHKAKLAKLREELEVAKKERQEYLDGWQRCKADSVNARKDAAREAERMARSLRDALVHDLIPALDSFDVATTGEQWESLSDGWRSGMEHVRNQILEALRQAGVERFGRAGETVDHAIHEVIEERDDVAGEANTIVRVVRYGYRRADTLLRPAHVVVKKDH